MDRNNNLSEESEKRAFSFNKYTFVHLMSLHFELLN